MSTVRVLATGGESGAARRSLHDLVFGHCYCARSRSVIRLVERVVLSRN